MKLVSIIAAALVATAPMTLAAPVAVVEAAADGATQLVQPDNKSVIEGRTDRQQEITARGFDFMKAVGECLEGLCGGNARYLDKPDVASESSTSAVVKKLKHEPQGLDGALVLRVQKLSYKRPFGKSGDTQSAGPFDNGEHVRVRGLFSHKYEDYRVVKDSDSAPTQLRTIRS